MTDLFLRARNRLESVPYTLLALPLRLAVATVFWNSGMTKLANWDMPSRCSPTSTTCRCCRRSWRPPWRRASN